LIIVTGVVCLIAVVGALGHYGILLKTTRDMEKLKAENRVLTEKVSRIEELDGRLAEYERYMDRINKIMGVGIEGDGVSLVRDGKGEPVRLEGGGQEVFDTDEDQTLLAHSMKRDIPSEWPLTRRGFITRGYTEENSSHPGVDIAVPQNTPVRATASGLVSGSGWDIIYGNYVEVQHSEGYSTIYGHNSRLIVDEGQWVRKGEIIAFSGSTGRSTAPHLHYEVRQKGAAVDPQPYLLGYGQGKRAGG
jgi:murein DD-endopeptidase MepM/ murein hydrolase activator NlpD